MSIVNDLDLEQVGIPGEQPSYENGNLESYEEWLHSRSAFGDKVAEIESVDPFAALAAKEAIYGCPIVNVSDDDDIGEHIDILRLVYTATTVIEP